MELMQQNLASGQLDLLSALVCLALAVAFGAGGGALGGMKLGGQFIGNKLSAVMGMTFGIIAALPGIILGLIVLKSI